ncbi:glycosyltransferase [Aquipluma nitroreducens]|uniref:Glycosyltransferase n=1 Tax=Aquipluma nitroreducens TaxID=2010828 RepID=A0A5K7S9T5_9BACT|nr:glycosyltransferase family 2 protein [Aquipluma nitroreducens]BBE18229.1 glycosyltransferase [Aquipluma nitroreducens]
MFSLIIPVYNEEGLIEELVARSVKALESFTTNYEILFVNDGSVDSTLRKLIEARKQYPRIKIVDLSRNFGHQAAFTAGLEMALGNYVAMMDGDLQDPPELLAEMYRMINEDGFDIVSGKRQGRKGKRLRVATNLFHAFFKKVSGIEDMENSGNFSVMNRSAVNAIVQMKETIRYLPGLRSFIGFRQGYVEYIREARLEGEPKMTLGKLIVLGADAIFSFSKFPIKVCLFLGTIGTIVFFIAGIYALVGKILGFALFGWSSTVLSIYFLGSIQLIFLGVVGEYVYRIYKESQNRPIYLVKKFYDADAE